MSRSSTITVRILGDNKGLSRALQESQGQVGGFRRVGSSIGSGLMGAATGAIKVAGGGATLVAGLAITKGMTRLLGIENAQAKLKGLGHDAAAVKTIMADALASVKGTAYGMDEAATTAASAVAAGIKPGKELEKYLRLTADAATIAGSSMSEMGGIINKVTTAGKAQADNLNQLADRGIPIFAWLQKEYGVSAEALSDMVSSGKVDAATFRKVIADNIGGAALESGNTTQGAMKNMMASLSRIGANFLGGVFPMFKNGFQGITKLMEPLEGAATRFGTIFGGALKTVADYGKQVFGILFQGDFKGGPLSEDSPFVNGLFIVRETLESLTSRVRSFFDGVGKGQGKVNPLVVFLRTKLIPAVEGVLESFGKFLSVILPIVQQTVAAIVENWSKIAPYVIEVWGSVRDIVIGVLGVIQQVITMVTSVIGFVWKHFGDDILAFTSRIFEALFQVIAGVMRTISGLIEFVLAIIKGDWGKAWDAIKKVFSGIWQAINGIAGAGLEVLQTIFKMAWAAIRAVIEGVWSAIVGYIRFQIDLVKSILSGAWSIVTGAVRTAWDTVKGLVSGALDSVVSTVTGLPGRITSAAKGAFDGIKSAFKSALNWIIDAWNGLEFKIPGFDPPGPGPKFGGFTLGMPDIPRLARGGIATGPTLAWLGEAGDREAVIPLNEQGIGFLRDALKAAMASDASPTLLAALLDAINSLRKDIQALPGEYRMMERVA